MYLKLACLLASAASLLCNTVSTVPPQWGGSDGVPSGARRVHMLPEFGFCMGLSPWMLLVGDGDKASGYRFVVKEIATGRMRPAAYLTEAFRCWNHAHLSPSPDCQYVAWRDAAKKLICVHLSGRSHVRRWPDKGDEHEDLLWLGKGPTFVVVTRHEGTSSARPVARLYDVRSGRFSTVMLPVGAILDGDLFGTDSGTVISSSWDGVSGKVRRVRFTEVRISPKPRVLRQTAVSPPMGDLVGLDVDRTGLHVLWTTSGGASATPRMQGALWSGTTSGSGWQLIARGTFASSAHWLGNRHDTLTFDARGYLWYLAVDGNRGDRSQGRQHRHRGR